MNKKDSLRLLKIVFAFLVLSLIIVVVLLVNKLSNINSSIENTTIVKKYNIDILNNLSIDFRNINLEIYSTNEDELIIKQYSKSKKLLATVSDNKSDIYIKEIMGNFFSRVIFKIYIPERYKNSINIINGFGNINISNIKNDIDIDNNSGKINIDNVKDIVITDVSGDIKIKSVNSISVNSTIADIHINNVYRSANIETITGDTMIKNFSVLEDSSIKSTSGDINININDNSSCKVTIYGQNTNTKNDVCLNGNNHLDISSQTGDIKIK